MDVRVDGMLYAAIAHPPVLGGKVKSVDDSATLKVIGVKKTIAIDPFKPPHAFQPLGGVAVIADNTFAAFKGRKQLKIEWDNGANAGYNSADYKKELQQTARQPGKVVHTIGDPDAEFAKGGKIVEAEYFAPHLAHASMEPPVAVADVRERQGDGVVAHAGSARRAGRSRQGARDQERKCRLPRNISRRRLRAQVEARLCRRSGRALEENRQAGESHLEPRRRHQVRLLPFGRGHVLESRARRRGQAESVAAAVGVPAHRFDFRHQGEVYGGAGEMSMGWNVIPFDVRQLPLRKWTGDGARPHRMAAVGGEYLSRVRGAVVCQRTRVCRQSRSLRLPAGADRIPRTSRCGAARACGSRRKISVRHGRLRHVAELAAEKANWGKKKSGKGTGMGIAVHRSFFTYVASVVEVEVDDQGAVRIPHVYTAVDAGIVANPEMVRQQFEGAAVFGTSIARTGEITATNGAVDQSNFYDYQVARMNDAPRQVDVHIVESTAPPAGVGEPGVPPFVPALCNAVFAATGKRVRELPLTRNGFS